MNFKNNLIGIKKVFAFVFNLIFSVLQMNELEQQREEAYAKYRMYRNYH